MRDDSWHIVRLVAVEHAGVKMLGIYKDMVYMNASFMRRCGYTMYLFAFML